MERGLDEVKHLLPGGKVTEDRMAVRVDQTRGNCHPLNVDDLIHPFRIKIFLLPNSLNQSSFDDKGIAIQERIGNIP